MEHREIQITNKNILKAKHNEESKSFYKRYSDVDYSDVDYYEGE